MHPLSSPFKGIVWNRRVSWFGAVLLHCWLLVGANAAAAEEILPVEAREQQDSLLCWAACVEMVVDFLGIDRSQCEIINAEFLLGEALDCCGISDTSNEWKTDCNMTSYGDVALEEFTQTAPKRRRDPLGWRTIKREINGGHPILYAYYNDPEQTSGHMVVIIGYSDEDDEQLLICWDPSKRSELGTQVRTVSYADYKSDTHWASTWKIRAP